MRVNENDKHIRNQCSLVVRVDGDEIEIPVTFGMTNDEICSLYPFLLPILNQKIENPAIQFSRQEKSGMFADLTKEEYSARLARIMKQSKFWYDKPDAGLLEIAVRFACDLKLKGISELSSLFGSDKSEAIAIKPVTQEEAVEIMRQLNLDVSEEPDKGKKSYEDYIDDGDMVDHRDLFTSRATDVDALIDNISEHNEVDIAKVMSESVSDEDVSKYVSDYKGIEISDETVENGVLKSSNQHVVSDNTLYDVNDDLDGTPVSDEYDETDEDEAYDDYDPDDFDESDIVDLSNYSGDE